MSYRRTPKPILPRRVECPVCYAPDQTAPGLCARCGVGLPADTPKGPVVSAHRGLAGADGNYHLRGTTPKADGGYSTQTGRVYG